MKISSRTFLPHVVAILLFIIIPSIYFSPMYQGKVLNQSDTRGYQGMVKEVDDYKKETGKDVFWTNSMFGGMPTYLIKTRMPNNILIKVHRIFTFQSGRPVVHIFLYMFGFYVLLLLFGFNPWLGIVGALMYGFSSYFFIILEPGHITKAIALGYMPMVIGSVYYAFRKEMIIGGVLTSIFVGLQLIANHLQITYYTILILLIFGIFELVAAIREKYLARFFKTIGVLLVAVMISASINIVNFWSVMDYTDYSLRGPSELTHDPENRTTGLDKSYALSWSYGIEETLNLLIPNFKGGTSAALIVTEDSKSADVIIRNYGQQTNQFINNFQSLLRQYWGTQPGTSGPVYIGAVVVFLFVFGMFFIRGRVKWWLFSVVVLSILLSWGSNFSFLSELFLDYFPGYNKFRTVSMTLVMAELAMPLLAVIAVSKLMKGDYEKQEFIKSLKYSLYVVGGIALFFGLFPNASTLSAPNDEILREYVPGQLISALEEDRANLLRKDAFRSLAFVLITGGLIYLYSIKKIKTNILLGALGLLLLIDLWPVNKRYINDENFVNKRAAETAFQPYQADLQILQDTSMYYRVYDITPGDPFASSRASYFHKSVGGYHGAKMRRFQEVYDFHLKIDQSERDIDPDILDMLNTKYLIRRSPENGQPEALRRTTNLGNAWFVSNVKIMEDADQEIDSLGTFDPATEALVDKRFLDELGEQDFRPDSLSFIELTSYAPDRLEYRYQTSKRQLAVFSDIYYSRGWIAKVNGNEVPYLRANYILRSMPLGPGEGSIVFEFRPDAYHVGAKIAFAGSALVVLMVLGGIFYYYRKTRTDNEE